MKKKAFETIAGGGTAHGAEAARKHHAVRKVQALGFRVGLQVWIGAVTGVIIGYNIAGCGKFHGTKFPLVVQTPLGIAKCAPGEIRLV